MTIQSNTCIGGILGLGTTGQANIRLYTRKKVVTLIATSTLTRRTSGRWGNGVACRKWGEGGVGRDTDGDVATDICCKILLASVVCLFEIGFVYGVLD